MSPRPARKCTHPDGCDRPHFGKGWCRTHYQRVYTTGDPGPAEIAKAPAKGLVGADHPAWKGRTVTYDGAHDRVIQARGRASLHTCAHCPKPARDWAYTHTDPAPLHDERGFAYSPDPAHYIPLCKACHTRYDLHRPDAGGAPD